MNYYYSNALKAFMGFLFSAVMLGGVSFGQTNVNGRVLNEETSEPMVGARVIVKGQPAGALTNEAGEFSFRSPISPPFSLVVTFFSFDTLTYQVTPENVNDNHRLQLREQALTLGAVEITATAQGERQLQSALSVESLSINAIKETPAANFYEGLGLLKGVDLTAASIAFRVVNTRGFNSTSPVRSLQIIDAVDNQAPGLNFALGNFLGSSELDVESVDLVVGASSAFYGPNAFNGVISMRTKSPFIHRGLSVMVKGAERSLGEFAIRYAKVLKDKQGQDRYAFKINAYYLTADDWVANNMDQAFNTRATINNPGGYDAVNRYGDENLSSGQNNATSSNQRVQFPGLERWNRTGYNEEDVVDYDTENLKMAGAFHYRVKDDVELIASMNYGSGTTVYQGDNRISLRGINFYQGRVEIQKPDKYFFRAYTTQENAGRTYDAVFTAFRLQALSKSDQDWSVDYRNFWNGAVPASVPGYEPGGMRRNVQQLDGFPSVVVNPDGTLSYDFDQYGNVLAANQDSLAAWHARARNYADFYNTSTPFLTPGTPEFQAAFDSITSTPISQGGTMFVDRSGLYHAHGEYKFTPTVAEFTVGANARLYTPVSEGTIFRDTSGTTITNFEFGVYGGAEKKFMEDRLKVNATVRVDKNENFPFVVSPAASAVFNITDNDIIRLSFSSALRNPTLSDQFLYFNVGRAFLVGNIDGFEGLADTASLARYFNSPNLDTSLIQYYDIAPVKPERVQTVEIGLRSTIFERLFVDASYYYSRYQDFLGFNIGVDVTLVSNRISSAQVYRVAANSQEVVTTQGASIGLNYFFDGGYTLSGNYSWNVLNTQSNDPIIPAYNTPEHKFNVGFSGRDLTIRNLRHVGFNVNYKWIEGFFFEGSPQFTGFVPTYDMVDMQVNKRVPKLKSTFKLGASNVLNNRALQVFGGPRIGRMAYFSVQVELDNL